MCIICNYNKYTYSAGMKERCRDGCRTSLLIAGVVLVPNIFHTLLPPCHPYITIHFMEMIFSTCSHNDQVYFQSSQMGDDEKMLVGKSSSTTTLQWSLQDTI